MSFSTREARVNAAVFKHLANARAIHTPQGGSPGAEVRVILDPARAVVDESGVVITQPVLDVLRVDMPLLAEGDQIAVVGGANYRVRSEMPEGDDAIVTVTLAKV
jgi:hypothetical protein